MIDEAVAAAITSNAAAGSKQEKSSVTVSPNPVPMAFQQPGYAAQYGQGIAGIGAAGIGAAGPGAAGPGAAGPGAGGYHGYSSPEMPAEPVQYPY